MYIEVGYKCFNKDGSYDIINHIIWDSFNNSMKLLTFDEYYSIRESISKPVYKLSYNGSVLAKISITGNRFTLYDDNIIQVYLNFNGYAWLISFSIYEEYRSCIQFNWLFECKVKFFQKNAYYCHTKVTEIYAEYLALNEEGRNREIGKILGFIHFSVTDSNGCKRVVYGYNIVMLGG